MSEPMALLHEIDSYLGQVLRPASEVVEVGPFTLYLNRETDLPFLSFARPAGPLPDPRSELGRWVEEVRTAFALRGRECRWEFLAETAPHLADALQAAGFGTPHEQPLLHLEPDALRPAAPAVAEWGWLGADDPRLPEVMGAQRLAFGLGEPVPADLEAGAAMIRRGMRLLAAWSPTGEVMAAGCHVPLAGVTELAGIATHPVYRRRGLAGELTSRLALDALESGCRVLFLSAGDDPARRVYERVGFRQVGTQLAVGEAGVDHLGES